jgi:hypothetical protein
LTEDRAYYLLFVTIHDVLKAERLLKDQDVDVEVVPVPRAISTDCGVCIRSRAAGKVLSGLLGDVKGLTCFFFDGADYKPEKHEDG